MLNVTEGVEKIWCATLQLRELWWSEMWWDGVAVGAR
jgi:hypothetical protein